MKKKLISLLMAVSMIASVTACGGSEAPAGEEATTQIANPWTDTTEEAAIAETYFLMKAPDGAENVAWRRMENGDNPLIEVDFTYDGFDFCGRAQYGAAEGEDISGMFIEWTEEKEEDLPVWWDGNAKATVKSGSDGEAVYYLCTWYDTEAGEVYSLSTSCQDDTNLDMLKVAGEMFDETKVPGYNAPDEAESETGDASEAHQVEALSEDHQALDISGCDTFTQIVDQKLTSGMGYANVNIDGTDVLLVSSMTYDNNAGEGEPFMAAIDAEIYYYTEEGTIGYMGYVTAGGTAYPLAVKDGKLYVGNNHGMMKVSVDPKQGEWVEADHAWVEYDSDGNGTYYHHSGADAASEEDADDALFNSYFDEYFDAEIILFDTVQ